MRSYSTTEHLARSLWVGAFGWANRMAMYSAYFDESGHPDGGEYLVVAGCVADVDQWVHFEREWLDVLAPLGIRVFHTVDFDQGKPPFDRLGESEQIELLRRLTGIIARRVEKTFAQVLRLDDYNAANHKYVFAECYGFPYPVLARSCMGQVSIWASKYAIPESNIRHFFENGAKHKGQLEWIAERDHLTIPVFLDKNEVVPLQAGDFLAWCSHHYLSTHGRPEQRYENVLNRLSIHSNEWGLINLEDPDRIPAILQIPLRHPGMRYKCVILRKDGRRRAVTHYWPKGQHIEPKVNRKTLVLPDKPILTIEQARAAAEQYAARKASVQS